MTKEPINGLIRTEKLGNDQVKVTILTRSGEELACCVLGYKEAREVGEAMVHQSKKQGAF